MKWGRKWGNFWGTDKLAENAIEIFDLQNTPPEALVRWDAVSGSGILYHVFVDGKLYAKTTGTELVVQFSSTGRHFVEILAGSTASQDEDLSAFVAVIPGGRAKLSWTASVSADTAYYKIYYDAGLGGSLSYLGRTKAAETSWISDELEDGTYVFRVNAVDGAGNERTSSSTATITIAKYPEAPSGLLLTSYDSNTETADFEFTESASLGVIGYHVYGNGGSGDVDFTTPIATVLAGNSTFSLSSIGVGTWKIAIRAYNASYEEDNVDVFEGFSVAGSPIDLLDNPPNVPSGLSAIPAAGGTFTLQCNYDAFGELAKATAVNFYCDDGLGGSINYTTPIATATVDDHETAEHAILAISATSSALVDGRTYTFAAKSASATGAESGASETTEATCDATAPTDITGLSGEAVNYEE